MSCEADEAAKAKEVAVFAAGGRAVEGAVG